MIKFSFQKIFQFVFLFCFLSLITDDACYAFSTKGVYEKNNTEMRLFESRIDNNLRDLLSRADLYRIVYLYFLELSLLYIASDYEIDYSNELQVRNRMNAFLNNDASDDRSFPVSWFGNPRDIPNCATINNSIQNSVCSIFSKLKQPREIMHSDDIQEILSKLNLSTREQLLDEINKASDLISLDNVLSKWADVYHAYWVAYYQLAINYALEQSHTANSTEYSLAVFALRDLTFFQDNNYQSSDVLQQMVFNLGAVFAANNRCGDPELQLVSEILSAYQAIGLSFAVSLALHYCSAERLSDLFLPKLEQQFNLMRQRRHFTLNQRQTMLQAIYPLDRDLAAGLFRNHVQRIDALDQAQNDRIAAVLFSALNLHQENADMRSDARLLIERLLRTNPEFGRLFLVLQLATLPPDDVPNQIIRYEQ